MQSTCQLSSKQVLPVTGGVDGAPPGGSNFVSGGSSPPPLGGWINPCIRGCISLAPTELAEGKSPTQSFGQQGQHTIAGE